MKERSNGVMNESDEKQGPPLFLEVRILKELAFL
jgi:hypothetical protein